MIKTHDFKQQQIQQKFKTFYGETCVDDCYAKQKFLPELKVKVKGSKGKNSVDAAVEIAFYDAFQGLPPFIMDVLEKKKNKLKQSLKAMIKEPTVTKEPYVWQYY